MSWPSAGRSAGGVCVSTMTRASSMVRCACGAERYGRLLAASVIPLAANCGGVALRSAACIRGVPGMHQGSVNPGTFFVHDGRGSSASSLSFSAIPARRLSNSSDPEGSGLSANAARVSEG